MQDLSRSMRRKIVVLVDNLVRKESAMKILKSCNFIFELSLSNGKGTTGDQSVHQNSNGFSASY